MSAHTKKHHISAHSYGTTIQIVDRSRTYVIPKKAIEKYEVETIKPKKVTLNKKISIKNIFDKLDAKYTKAGALLKGLRLREGLSQVAFAKIIEVTQANLSNMEHGKRPIGRIVAKRIEKAFGTNYRYFLE